MATFYLLPPRECLEQQLAAFCGRVLPGLDVPAGLWEHVAEALAVAAADDVYVVHREDLPGLGDPATDLAVGFGAEPGDAVVDVGLAVGSAPPRVRRWVVPCAVSEPAVGR